MSRPIVPAVSPSKADMHGLITNSSLFGSGSDRNVRVAGINFLRSLPARDSDPILPGNLTSDPTQAAFVEVTVEPIGCGRFCQRRCSAARTS